MPVKTKTNSSNVSPERTSYALGDSLTREENKGKGAIRTSYVHRQLGENELKNPEPTKSMQKVRTRDVRHAIEEVFGPEVYKKTDEIRLSSEETDRTVPLHGSAGRHLAEKGEYVLELNIAGSGFTEFRKMEHNMTGKHTFTAEPVQDIRTARITHINGEVPDPDSPDFLRRRTDNASLGKMLDAIYGERYRDPEGKMSEYIRTKTTEEGIEKVFIPGPEDLDTFMRDKKRSMDSARHNALKFAQDFLTKKFQEIESGEIEKAPINILMQGHSRGGVAIGESLQMIESWVNQNYPRYRELVNYRLTQFDPVPGAGSYLNHKDLDLEAGGRISDGLGTAERENSAPFSRVRTTVMYSMKSTEDFAHKWGFDPQFVKGAGRIIISPECHSLHLGTADNSQKDGLSKIAFTLAETGEVYRGSGLNDLPDGVYLCDENHTLIKCDDLEKVKEVMQKVAGRELGQHTRIDTVTEAAKSCLLREARVKEDQYLKKHPEEDTLPVKPVKPSFFKRLLRGFVSSFNDECRKYEEDLLRYDLYQKRMEKREAGRLGAEGVPPERDILRTTPEDGASKAMSEEISSAKSVNRIAEQLYEGLYHSRKKVNDSPEYQENLKKLFEDPVNKENSLEKIKGSAPFLKLIDGKSTEELRQMAKAPTATYNQYLKLTVTADKAASAKAKSAAKELSARQEVKPAVKGLQ